MKIFIWWLGDFPEGKSNWIEIWSMKNGLNGYPICHDVFSIHRMPVSKHLVYPVNIYIYYVSMKVKNKIINKKTWISKFIFKLGY